MVGGANIADADCITQRSAKEKLSHTNMQLLRLSVKFTMTLALSQAASHIHKKESPAQCCRRRHLLTAQAAATELRSLACRPVLRYLELSLCSTFARLAPSLKP